MSRSDQWIGLTPAGRNMYHKLTKLAKENKIPIGYWAFNPGKIFGSEFVIEDRIYREEIQASPWSSGPMFFTRFAIYNKNTNKKICTICDWIEDSKVQNEVDYENGKFYV